MSALSRARVPAGAFWIAALVLWVGVTHTGFLATEVANWDESTSVLIAASVLDGHLPYVALFDVRPPMIYFMLAGTMAAFGESISVARLFGAVCVLVSSIAAFAIARRSTDPVSAGLAALMLVAVTAASNWGAVFSELPATASFMTALWLCLARGDRLWAAAAAGALLALAVLTRTNLFVVAAVIGLWLVCARAPAGARLRTGAVLALAAAVPPIPIFLLYWSVGALAELRLVLIDVRLAFAEHAVDPAEALRNFAEAWLRFLEWRKPLAFGPFTLGVVVGLAAAARGLLFGERRKRREIAPLLLVFAMVFVSIIFFGDAKGHRHNWLQLFPILTIFCAGAIAWARRAVWRRWIARAAILLCCAGTAWRDVPGSLRVAANPAGVLDGYAIRRAARAIAEVREPREDVWALERHLVYWYLDTLPRSRLAHPSDFTKPWTIEPLSAAGYVRRDVLRATMAARPAWLVTRAAADPAPWYLSDDDAVRLRRMIADDYAVFHEGGGTRVYRRLRRGGGAPDSPGAERR